MSEVASQGEQVSTARLQRSARAVEFLLVFFGIPTASALGIWPYHPFLLALPLIVIGALWLFRHSEFDRESLRRLPRPGRNLAEIVALFVIGGTALTLFAWYVLPPDQRFWLPRFHPRIWLLILVLYSIISVFPQELIFRAFLFERYKPLFRSPLTMLLATAIAFAYAHVVFHNWVAPLLCVAGGLIFGYRYQKTRSLLLVSIEHALWGILVLSIGLEKYFLTHARFLHQLAK